MSQNTNGIRVCNVFFTLISLTFFSCSSTGQINNKGIIQQKTHFYNIEGQPTFTHYLKLFYKDSLVIEEIRGVNTVTDTANITTVTYPLLFCRYIDLRNKILYDYKTFSDTAKIIHQAVLPDSLMLDGGWSFYSEKHPKIQGTPELLSDTIIDNIIYKRAKFHYTSHNPKKGFLIGYFRCDGKGDMFSMEKAYSRKLNCTMVKFFDYKTGFSKPFASREVFYISNVLSKAELKIFDTWEKNAKEHPVDKIVGW